MSAQPTTMAPASMMMNTAGPSPLSIKEKSSPQASQLGRRLRNPAYSFPLPQRGHLHANPRNALCVTVGSVLSSIRDRLFTKQKGGPLAALLAQSIGLSARHEPWF